MGHDQRQREAEAGLHNQENLLPTKQLIFVFSLLAMSLLVMFIDQNGISQLLPIVAKDLDATETISWAGTSSLIGNTVFQVLYGRLSDIFGRKKVYLSALALLSFSDLMCGLSEDAPMLYVFRGLAGVAGGGITALSMIIVSDIVSLERRGKYQGILGSMVGLGNLIGPLIAATFASKATWRGLFWMLCPLLAICCGICGYFLPSTAPTENLRQSVGRIDFGGVLTASSGLILVLVPLSGGGSYFQWNSPMVISMMTMGGVLMAMFVIVEWKFARLPMMPMSIWKNGAVASILVQSFFFGITFYGYLYYLPLYYQNVKQYSVLKSALLTIPLTTSQSIASICSGQYISRMKRYGECIIVGFTLLTIAVSLTALFNRTTPVWANVVILLLMGTGNGNVFQPSIISLQAHSPKSQRAVVISMRNFLRCLGGAVGLAVSAAILQNVLRSSLPPQLQNLAHSTYAKPNYTDYSPHDAEIIMNAYQKASHTVFVFYAPVAAISLICCVFVKDRGLQRQEDVEAELREKEEAEHTAAEAAEDENRDLEMGRSKVSLESHLKSESGDVTTVSKLSLAESSHEKLERTTS